MIVETLGLGGVDIRMRHARLHGERDAGREPAAGGGDRDHVGRQPERGEILDDLAADGALPGDDQRIVVGRHQHALRRVAMSRAIASRSSLTRS